MKELLINFWRENKLQLTIYIILISLAYPIDTILIPKVSSEFFQNVKPDSTNEFYKRYLFYAILAFLIIYTSYFIINKLDSELVPKFEKYVDDSIYTYILNKNQDDFKNPEIAELLHRMHVIPSAINGVMLSLIERVLPQIITIICIIIYLFFVNKTLGRISLTFFVIYGLVMYIFSNNCELVSLKNEILNEEKQNILTDKFQNLFSIYSNGKIKDEIIENEIVTETFKDVTEQNMKCNNKIKTFNLYFSVFIVLSLIIVAVILYKQNKITHVVLIAAILIINYLPHNIQSIGYSIPNIINNYTVINKNKRFIDDVFNVRPENEKVLTITDGHISINGITFGYADKENIFNNFSLDIPAKSTIQILGESGKGKSTLIKLITGYYKLKGGQILIDGTDISTVNLNELRKSISYISQNNVLFNKSIFENIRYGNNQSKEYITNLINRLNITLFNNLDLDAQAGIMGDNLSGGQKQMIHILRAICKDNKIVIMDEPTSSIDTTNKEQILNALKELSKNSTMILITHESLGLTSNSIKI